MFCFLGSFPFLKDTVMLKILFFSLFFTFSVNAAFVESFTNLGYRQVVQRNPRNQANVSIAGSIDTLTDRIDFRASPVVGYSGLDTGWITLENNVSSTFSQDVVLNGGWYDLEIRAYDDQGILVDQAILNKFGVGEVFVIAGQSNAANTGETKLTPQDDRVNAFVLDSEIMKWHEYYNSPKNIWQLAVDPQPIATHSDGSSWPPLGDSLAAYYDVPIGFTNVAWSGSSVSLYADPNNVRYTRLMDAVSAFGIDGFRSVIWHQGEADNSMDPNLYAQKLNWVINETRVNAGFDVRWGVALAAAREGQQMVIDGDTLVFQGADTDIIGPEHRIGVHWAESGQYLHAGLWFDELAPLIDSLILTPGDINGDSLVDISDLGIVGNSWGTNNPIADWNADGLVDISDLSIVGSNWDDPSQSSLSSIPSAGISPLLLIPFVLWRRFRSHLR